MSKRKKIFINSSLLVMAIAPIVLYAYEYGPDPGYTGAPGDNATACIASGCHTGTINTGKGNVQIVASGGTNYVPGQTQTIKVTVTDSTEKKYGFQLTARADSNPSKTEAGFLIPASDGFTQVLCADGSNLDTPTFATGCTAKTGGTLEWIEHTLNGYNKSNGTPGSYTYTFTWTPPSSNVGPVTLYAAGNAVTGALVVTGTETYTTKLQLTPSAGGGNSPTVGGAVSAATNAAGGAVAAGSWMSIYGTNLAPAGDSRQITGADIVAGNLPTNMDGTSATVNGKPAFMGYLSPGQINIELPDDTSTGMVPVVVTTGGGSSTAVMVNLQRVAPGLFMSGQGNYIAAQHANGSAVGGFTGSTPAAPGETIVLWATGLGPASPAVPAGQVITAAPAAPGNLSGITVTIGGQPATVAYAGKTISGDDQVNVQVPAGMANGDQAVVITIGGVSSQANANIAVHN